MVPRSGTMAAGPMFTQTVTRALFRLLAWARRVRTCIDAQTEDATMPQTTGFYNRTAFRVLQDPLPDALHNLDQDILQRFPDLIQAWGSKQFGHAENLCRRYGDVLLMQHHAEEALARSSRPEGAALGTSYLTAYFASVKSLLDVTAIMLDDVYSLGFSGGDLDLAKDHFWNRFNSTRRAEADRYASVKPWFKEVRNRRDAAIHRVAPILMTAGPGHPNKVDPSLTTVLMVDLLDVKVQDLMKPNPAFSRSMISPLDLLRGWQPKLFQIMELACEDLRSV